MHYQIYYIIAVGATGPSLRAETSKPLFASLSDSGIEQMKMGDYHNATFPMLPRSSVAVPIRRALNTRLIVGIVMLYPLSRRDI